MSKIMIDLPCNIGDEIYYTTAWNKYSAQPQHKETVVKFEIYKDKIVVVTKWNHFNAKDIGKTIFTCQEQYERESKIIRQAFIYEQQLRAENDKPQVNENG